jgi:ribose transport system ATP-binding protein
LSGDSVKDASFDMRFGEVLGITGLLGMGYEEIPYLLFGAKATVSGTMDIDGRVVELERFDPRSALSAGLALLPANRLRDGAVPDASVAENVTLTTLPSYFSRGVLRHKRERSDVKRLLHQFQVNPPDPDRQFFTLSGGNQQKALVARCFKTKPRAILLDEPTQGVDIGARQQIFENIRAAATSGSVVLIASAEHEDLAHLCDRVLVFRNGAIVAELQGDLLNPEGIMQECFRTDESRPLPPNASQGP